MSTCKGNYFPTRVFIPPGPSGSWESAHRPPSPTAVTPPGQPPALQSPPPPRCLKFTVQVLLPRSPSKKSPAPGGGLLRAGVLPLWSSVSRVWSLNPGEDPTELPSVEPFLWDRLSVSPSDHPLSRPPPDTGCTVRDPRGDIMLASACHQRPHAGVRQDCGPVPTQLLFTTSPFTWQIWCWHSGLM